MKLGTLTSRETRNTRGILSESNCSPVKEDPIFALLGDTAHYLSLGSSFALAHAISSYASHSNSTFFDEQWRKHGGCITNTYVPYLSSHDVCFYFDVTAVLVLMLVYTTIGRIRGMSRANEVMQIAILGLFVMGIEHCFLGKSIRDRTWVGGVMNMNSGATILSSLQQQDSVLKIMVWQVPVHSFWAGLTKLSMPGLSNIEVGVVSTTALLAHMTLPVQFGFLYVQALAMVGISFHQLARDYQEKDFIYATFPMMVLVPANLVRWLESSHCSDLFRDKFYGQLGYDAFIACSVYFWYVLCYLHICGSVATSKSLKRVEFGGETVVTFETSLETSKATRRET
ncbi:hypothetical protein ACA910_013271 [Epithemia clementina (nom. ined.)]